MLKSRLLILSALSAGLLAFAGCGSTDAADLDTDTDTTDEQRRGRPPNVGCDSDAECADTNPCTRTTCQFNGSNPKKNGKLGFCKVLYNDTPDPDNGACDDGEGCTTDTCSRGACVNIACGGGISQCSAADTCSAPGPAGVCQPNHLGAGTGCNDNNACTGASGSIDQCDGNGNCLSGSPTQCLGPAPQCKTTAGSFCDSAGACNYPNNAPELQPCGNGTGTCQSGQCIPNGPPPCSCDPAPECYTSVGASCVVSPSECNYTNFAPDDQPCSSNTGTCQSGQCIPNNPPPPACSCDPAPECYTSVGASCVVSPSECNYTDFAPDTQPCSFGNGQCFSGQCIQN